MTKIETKRLNNLINELMDLHNSSITKSRLEINIKIAEIIAELQKMAGE